jgi:hypothetical protein
VLFVDRSGLECGGAFGSAAFVSLVCLFFGETREEAKAAEESVTRQQVVALNATASFINH